MTLKIGDKIRFTAKGAIYELVGREDDFGVRTVLFKNDEQSTLSCPFVVNDFGNISEEEFNTWYSATVWEHLDGSELFPKPKFYSIGERFICGISNEEYILAQVGIQEICLVSLTSGNYWYSKVKVESNYKITEDEFKQICADKEFTKVV